MTWDWTIRRPRADRAYYYITGDDWSDYYFGDGRRLGAEHWERVRRDLGETFERPFGNAPMTVPPLDQDLPAGTELRLSWGRPRTVGPWGSWRRSPTPHAERPLREQLAREARLEGREP